MAKEGERGTTTEGTAVRVFPRLTKRTRSLACASDSQDQSRVDPRLRSVVSRKIVALSSRTRFANHVIRSAERAKGSERLLRKNERGKARAKVEIGRGKRRSGVREEEVGRWETLTPAVPRSK